jgi:hypothetical protein
MLSTIKQPLVTFCSALNMFAQKIKVGITVTDWTDRLAAWD